MRRFDRRPDVQPPDRPAPPVLGSLAIALAVPAVTVVLLLPHGPLLALLLAVSAVAVAVFR